MNQVNFQAPDLNLLRVFDEVMTGRSLTRAARKLSITQPASHQQCRHSASVFGGVA